jgi:hypothetical protein
MAAIAVAMHAVLAPRHGASPVASRASRWTERARAEGMR